MDHNTLSVTVYCTGGAFARLVGLPADAGVQDVLVFFAQFDAVDHICDYDDAVCMVPSMENGRPSVQSFVMMKSVEHAMLAQRKLDKQYLDDRCVAVFVCGPDGVWHRDARRARGRGRTTRRAARCECACTIGLCAFMLKSARRCCMRHGHQRQHRCRYCLFTNKSDGCFKTRRNNGRHFVTAPLGLVSYPKGPPGSGSGPNPMVADLRI